MRLIIGGANQGKVRYANQLLKTKEEDWCDGRICEKNAILKAPYIMHFESYIKRALEDRSFLETLAETIIEKNPDAVIITDEIGMGLVPMEEQNRYYREMTGRICTKLCAFATKVERVNYGIGMVIKDDTSATDSTW